MCLLFTVVTQSMKEGFIMVINDKFALFVDCGESMTCELWGSISNFTPLKSLFYLLTMVICESWGRVRSRWKVSSIYQQWWLLTCEVRVHYGQKFFLSLLLPFCLTFEIHHVFFNIPIFQLIQEPKAHNAIGPCIWSHHVSIIL